MTLEVGTVLAGRYRLAELVGRGGQADVWRAADPVVRREVAIKVVHPHLVTDAGRDRLLREAEALGRLRHPGVVQLYDVIDDADGLALVMEYVPGTTLEDRVAAAGGHLAWDECAAIGAAVASALAAAHDAGIVHRDVKPRNILIRPDGEVRLTDFGIARLVGAARLSQTGMAIGSPGYWAPEQVLGLPITAQTDVYGLAAALFFATTGRPPQAQGTDEGAAEGLLAGVMRRAPDPAALRPDLPPHAAATLRRGLERDPDDRFASAGDLAAALGAPWAPASHERLADTRAAATVRLPAPRRARPSVRRILPWAVGAILIAALAGWLWGGAIADDDAGQQRVAGGGASVALPAGWRPIATPDTGLGLAEAITIAPPGDGVSLTLGEMTVAPPRLFPAAFGRRIHPPGQRPATDDLVSLAGVPARRFADLGLDGGAQSAAIYVAPIDEGTLVAACLAPDAAAAALAECEAALGTLRLDDGEPGGVVPDAALAADLSGALAEAAEIRDAGLADAAAAGSRRDQEAVLTRLADRLQGFAADLPSGASDPALAAREAQIATLLSRYAGALRRAGAEVRGNRLEAYRGFLDQAARIETRLLASVERLAELGYAVVPA